MSRLTVSHFGRVVLAVVVCCLFLGPLRAHADDYEQYQQAKNAVETLASGIRMGEGAVGQVLMEAMQSNHGDMKKWNDLDAKMTELGGTIDSNLPEISRNAAVILALNPDEYLPSVSLGQPFAGNLKMAADKKKELLDLAKSENDKLDKTNKLLAQMDRNILNAAKHVVTDTIEDAVLPSQEELGGEAAIVVLSLYFGPPGWVVGTVVAGSFAFNDLIALYYNSQAAADQTRVLSQMKQSLQDRKAKLEKNISTLTEGAREMYQIEQILAKHEKKVNEYKAKITAAMDSLNEQYKSAFEAKKKKLDEEAQKLAAQPKPEIKMGGWYYGMENIPPITSGEYAGEVDSMISQMRSYVQAVEDGGDPDNYQIMVTDWHNRLNDRYRKAREEYDQKYKLYSQASEVCGKATNAASDEYNRAWNAIWNGCRPWNDSCRNALQAAGNRYNAAVNAAYAGLRPFGQALVSPYREMVKLQHIHSPVASVAYPFGERINNATRAHTRDFWNEYRLWETKFGEANTNAYNAVSDVPYWIDQWKDRANKLDEEIQRSLYWGGNIADIRTGLLATASQLKDLHKTVQEATKKYAEANSERMRVANLAQTELTGILNKYGKLVNYYWSSYFSMNWLGSPMEFTPHAPEQEKNIKAFEDMIKKTFTLYEPENLKNAQKLDILWIAAVYESKANELTFYTDWVDTYRHRASTAAGALNRISMEKTAHGFYGARGGTAQEVLKKEFTQPPWSTISRDADKYVSKGDFSALPWATYQPWDSLGVWQKLYAGQNILMAKLDKEARYYIQIRSQGGFQPVPAGLMKALEDDWKKLREVCERYDVLAKAERDKIGADGQEKVQKAGQIVFETFNKMPKLSRDIVQGEHSRFQGAYSWLISYLGSKVEAVRPSLQPPTNSVALQLDNLILGYAPAYEKWKREQEEAQRRAEEQRRQWEAAEKLRIEQEKKKAEEERRAVEAQQKKSSENIVLVKDFYTRFKEAYEGRNDSQVMSMISDGWQAGDGSTLSDLQMTLRRTFKTFDEIRYNIQNLSITPGQDGRYSISYDVTITSRIYKRNLKHEEKSSIYEEVTIDQSGKAKISKTLGGRFWYVQ